MDVQGPPQAKQPPGFSFISQMLAPALTGMGSLALVIVMTQRLGAAGMNYQPYVIAMGAVLAVSVLVVPALNHFNQRRQARRSNEREATAYRMYLEELEQRLQAHLANVVDILTRLDPPLEELAERLLQRTQLWERRPADPDFLAARIGIGRRESFVRFHYSAPPNATTESLAVERLMEGSRQVDGVPRLLEFCQSRGVGVVGEPDTVRAWWAAITVHLAVSHSPDELMFRVLSGNLEEWSWCKWLPHAELHAATEGPVAVRQMLAREVAGRQEVRDQGGAAPLPYVVCVFDFANAREAVAGLDGLFEAGAPLGLVPVFLVTDTDELPGNVGTVVRLDETEQSLTIQETGRSAQGEHVARDGISREDAETCARALGGLAPVPERAEGGVPTSGRLVSLFGLQYAAQFDPLAAWEAGRHVPEEFLRIPLGWLKSEEPLFLNLRQDGYGPHGLITGTTGAGKSELLQSLILSLAMQHSPRQVEFVLIDYKGGTAFQAFDNLPHKAGETVTDLDEHLAGRVITALRAEIQRREILILQNKRPGRDFPEMIIVVDEFSRLKREVPEFVERLIDVVEVGRQLGIHILLSTLNPAAALSDAIKDHTRFKICLRVENPQISRDVIGRPDAAFIPSNLPGRAYLRVGNDEVFTIFQTAQASVHEQSGTSDNVQVKPFAQEARAVLAPVETANVRVLSRAAPADGRTAPPRFYIDATDVRALVEKLAVAAGPAGRARSPWPAALPARLLAADAAGLPERANHPDPVVRIGALDDPSGTSWLPWDLPLAGHSFVVGASGSGKSWLLAAIAVALAQKYSPEAVRLVILDFASQRLSPLKDLPHCAGVISQSQPGRLRRLLRELSTQIEERAAGLRGPDTVVLLDGLGTFNDVFEEQVPELARLLRDGREAGIHWVITSTRVAGSHGSITSNLLNRIALNQTDRSDFSLIVDRLDTIPSSMAPGRAFFRRDASAREGQIVSPNSSPEEAIEQGVRVARERWQDAPRPSRIADLKPLMPLSDLVAMPAGNGNREEVTLRFGFDDRDLRPAGARASQCSAILIAGRPGGGKSTALATLALDLAGRYPPSAVRLYVAQLRDDMLCGLQALPHIAGWCQGIGDLPDLLTRLEDELEQPAAEAERAVSLLLMDDYDEIRSAGSDRLPDRLAKIVERARQVRAIVVAGGDAGYMTMRDPFLTIAKSARLGLLLQGDRDADTSIYFVTLPRANGEPMPPGRALFVDRTAIRLIQVASPQAPGQSVRDAIERHATLTGRPALTLRRPAPKEVGPL